jgi:hypothetical protein
MNVAKLPHVQRPSPLRQADDRPSTQAVGYLNAAGYLNRSMTTPIDVGSVLEDLNGEARRHARGPGRPVPTHRADLAAASARSGPISIEFMPLLQEV